MNKNNDKDARAFDKFSNNLETEYIDKDARAFDKFSNNLETEYIDKDARAFDKFSNEISFLNEIKRQYSQENEKKQTNQRNLRDNSHLEKHEKYLEMYKSNELFWGLGIENEFYLECEKKSNVSKEFFLNNHKRERYSVNYYSNYDENLKNEAFSYTNPSDIDIPFLINSHSFTDTDVNNNHKTLEKSKKITNDIIVNKETRKVQSNLSNPNFLGKTLGEDILTSNKDLFNTFNKTWLYDGDTFEITTVNFYKTDIYQMIEELEKYKQDFISNVQKYQTDTNLFSDFGQIKIMEKNYPFAIHMTNLNNIGIFNNGTLHYNLTLPTELDDKMLIKNQDKFNEEHKEAIKIIQWFEPLLVPVYGTPDYFSQLVNYTNADKFSASSQRCAVSRYIGLGTYDTDKMTKGKILLTELANFPDYFWYNKYHETSAYNKLEKIGLDINFNKHYNHGIEIRFFDHIPQPELIKESFEFIIYLIDLIFENNLKLDNPIKTRLWNDLVCNVMKYGKKYIMSQDEKKYFEKILDMKIDSSNIYDFYYEVHNKLKTKFSICFKSKFMSVGKFSRHVLMPKKILIKNVNKIELDLINFNINEIINMDKFMKELEVLIDNTQLPFEVLNIVEIVNTLEQIQEQINQMNKLDTNKSDKCVKYKTKMIKDINHILQTSINILNYNIEKILENKNKLDTQLFIKIINLIECFKMI